MNVYRHLVASRNERIEIKAYVRYRSYRGIDQIYISDMDAVRSRSTRKIDRFTAGSSNLKLVSTWVLHTDSVHSMANLACIVNGDRH